MTRLALFITLLTLSVTAADKKPSFLENITQPKISFQTDFLSDANFDGFDASLKTYKQNIQVNNDIFGVSLSRWDFDWNNEASLPFYKGKTPISSMQRFRIYANLPVFLNDKWFMLNAISVNATYEKEYANSFGAGIVSFFSYKVNKEHAIQIGAFANYHPAKTLALPVLGYTYRIRETDGLSVLLGFPRAYVAYHINEALLFNAGMIYSQAIIRLADDSGIEERGYVEAKDYQANVGVRYEFNEHLELSTDLLYTFKRDFTIFNHDADELESYGIDSSAGVIVKLKYLF